VILVSPDSCRAGVTAYLTVCRGVQLSNIVLSDVPSVECSGVVTICLKGEGGWNRQKQLSPKGPHNLPQKLKAPRIW